jgi:hypothetical protein
LVADAAIWLDYRPMTATETAPVPEPPRGGKAASEARVGNYAFRTGEDVRTDEDVQAEEDEALRFASAALGRVKSKLDGAAGDLEQIVRDLEARDLESAGEDGDRQQIHDAEQALAQIQPLIDFLGRLRKRGRHQDPGDALSVVAQMSALTSDVEAARDRSPASDSPPGPPPHRPPLYRLWDAALGKIREALPHVWAFISRLFTPTQWSVAGNVSTGIFGFAGASISITFGSSG